MILFYGLLIMPKISVDQNTCIIVTGCCGQLGQAFEKHLKFFEKIHFLDKIKFNLTSEDSIAKAFKKYNPDVVINTAAYTNVDDAEVEREKALIVNGSSLENLTKYCKKYDALLIHFSTDYVFDGSKLNGYLETDSPNPINYYGQTKLHGENVILNSKCNFLIFRISWLYSQYGKNFYKTISKLSSEKKDIDVVNDQSGIPTSADFVVSKVYEILFNTSITEDNCNQIYHLAPKRQATWYDFAKEIVKTCNNFCTVNPVSSETFKTRAVRPKNSLLSSEKFEKSFKVDIKDWQHYYKTSVRNN